MGQPRLVRPAKRKQLRARDGSTAAAKEWQKKEARASRSAVFCNRCGVDLKIRTGLCKRCADYLGVPVPRPLPTPEQLKAKVKEDLRQREEETRRAYVSRLVPQRKAADAKRRAQTFPRASDVTITHSDGTAEVRAAYATPRELHKVAPEREPIPAYLRRRILARDDNACRYCGNMDGPFHMDHVVPVSKGGPTTQGNLVTACETCNLRKGAQFWKPNPLPRRRRA